MKIADRVKTAVEQHQAQAPDPDDLRRLERFFSEMKALGVAKAPQYDLPLPDTLGRTVTENVQNKPHQL
jgi:hypothetical protein